MAEENEPTINELKVQVYDLLSRRGSLIAEAEVIAQEISELEKQIESMAG